MLLAQTEVAEVAEGGGEGRGGSSTMPHKRNPVGAIGLIACAQRGPGLVATMLAAMLQEHERGAGGLAGRVGDAAGPAPADRLGRRDRRELLAGLEVDPEKMRARHGPDRRAGDERERGGRAVAFARALRRPGAGRAGGTRSVESGREFREVLLELPEVADGLGAERLDAALDPAGYLGVTAQLIDRALEAHRGR